MRLVKEKDWILEKGVKAMKGSRGALAMAICILATASGGEKATFFQIDKASQIFGQGITAADLKGKVVFLKYWGINCPPCRPSQR